MADPTDRELLELAAKAAGLPYRRHDPERKAALEEARAQLQRPIGVEVSEYPSLTDERIKLLFRESFPRTQISQAWFSFARAVAAAATEARR